MYDFMLAALPWIAIGLAVAIVLAHFAQKKKKSEEHEQTEKKRTGDTQNNYFSYAICIGMLIGTTIGSLFIVEFGSNALAYGCSYGMLAGVVVGLCIKKK